MVTLNEVLTLIAAQIQADAQALISYAAEDTLGGYHVDPTQRTFPIGSIWGVEGQILYALARWYKPEIVVEIGGWAGCSASHLALACLKNGVGQVYSVDNGSELMGEHGIAIPGDLRPFVSLIQADGQEWLAAQEDASIGLLFEDASHAVDLIVSLGKLALQKLIPGAVLVNHDAGHDFAYLGDGSKIPSGLGSQVRDGLVQAGLYFRPYLAEPSDCGVAVTVIPGVISVGAATGIFAPEFSPSVKVETRIFDDNSETGYRETPQLSDAQKMHHAIFGLTYRGVEKSDDELLQEVFDSGNEELAKTVLESDKQIKAESKKEASETFASLNKSNVPDERPKDSYESEPYSAPKKRGRKPKNVTK